MLQVQVSILLIPEFQEEEEEEETTYRHFNGDSGQWCRELNPGRDDGYGETSNWDRVIWNTRNAKVGSAENFTLISKVSIIGTDHMLALLLICCIMNTIQKSIF